MCDKPQIRGTGRGSGNGPPDFSDTEKRTEIEIDNLLVMAPPDFWTFHRLCNWFQTGAGSCRTNKYFIEWDHPFKTSASLRGGGVSPCADGQNVKINL